MSEMLMLRPSSVSDRGLRSSASSCAMRSVVTASASLDRKGSDRSATFAGLIHDVNHRPAFAMLVLSSPPPPQFKEKNYLEESARCERLEVVYNHTWAACDSPDQILPYQPKGRSAFELAHNSGTGYGVSPPRVHRVVRRK